jgi:hypothetical protein
MRHVRASSPIERLNYLLRGRKPYPWGESVGLSRGTVYRLLKGQFPDPGSLVEAVRREGLSMSWWLAGAGTPYFVRPAVSTADAIETIEDLRSNENLDWFPLIVWSAAGATPVLHRQMISATDTEPPMYWTVEIIPCDTIDDQLVHVMSDKAAGAPRMLELDASDWRRLATGYMSTTELFGWRDTPGLIAKARPLDAKLIGAALGSKAAGAYVAEPDPAYTFASPIERALLDNVRRISETDRETITRITRLLADD